MKNILPLLLCLGLFSTASLAATKSELIARVSDSANVLIDMNSVPDRRIPVSLMNSASCVATFPHVVQAAFVVGGIGGRGVVSCQIIGGKWSEPSYVTLAGGSWGLQAGAEAADVILIFTGANAPQKLSQNTFKLGVDLSAAAGPVGRDAQVGTDYKMGTEVFSYSRAKGLFAGVSLSGTALTVDKNANAQIYGDGITAAEILKTPADVTSAHTEYVNALHILAP